MFKKILFEKPSFIGWRISSVFIYLGWMSHVTVRSFQFLTVCRSWNHQWEGDYMDRAWSPILSKNYEYNGCSAMHINIRKLSIDTHRSRWYRLLNVCSHFFNFRCVQDSCRKALIIVSRLLMKSFCSGSRLFLL